MRVNTNVSNKTRRELVLDDFKGVDFSSSPLKVSGSRASFASNLICDNGVNHKRPGWEQVLKLEGNINGMYEYKNGNHHVLIVYAGEVFYSSQISSSGYGVPDQLYINDDKNKEFKFLDQRIQFFMHKERLYIIGCGDYLVYGTWDNGEKFKLCRVSDAADTYVPTTMYNGNVFEKVNILTPKRKNTFKGVIEQNIANYFYTERAFSSLNSLLINDVEVKIDGNKIICLTKKPVESKVTKADSKNYTCSCFEPGIGMKMNYLPEDITNGDYTYETEYSTDYYDEDNKSYSLTKTTYTNVKCKDCGREFGDIEGESIQKGAETVEGEVGALVSYTGDNKYSGFYISKNINGWQGEALITAEFEVTEKNERDYIPYCSFGSAFGAYGNSDRLFLSGNPLYPNADFYSEYDDFTYFTAASQTVMGSKDVPITGYLRLSDSTLATLKAETLTEPTIYYRTAAEKEIELENGQKTSEVIFTRWTGGINEGCVNPYCTALFADDNLMVSPNGVRGIVQISNSATNERYVRERDKFINNHLLKHDLSGATAIVYKNRYYLAVDDVCYVADPRYKTYRNDDIDGSFNYEWWYWENIPARVFSIVNGELWFGTEEGMICRFDDKFTDRTYDETEQGQLTTDGETLIHEANMDVEVCDGDEIELSGYDGRLYVTGYNGSECTFMVSKEKDGDSISNIRDELKIGTSALTMKVWCYKNVVSKWFSPVLDLGAFDVSKTLLSMSITVDPTVRGKVRFGYDSRDVERYISSKGDAVLDFDVLNFEEFSFDTTGFATSHTVKSKLRNFNYIMFKLISDNAEDCAVCNLKAVYQYNGRLKGVK